MPCAACRDMPTRPEDPRRGDWAVPGRPPGHDGRARRAGASRFRGQSVEPCRSGHSANEPLSDLTHHRVDFLSRPGFLRDKQEIR